MTKRFLFVAAIILGFVALVQVQGPLTPLGSLRVRTDENGYLLIAASAAGITPGPLTPGSNVRVRTDSNGYLMVACQSGCGGGVPAGWTLDADGIAGPSGVAALGITSSGTPGGYTLAASGILVRNAAGDEVFRLWGTDPDSGNFNSTNLYIGVQSGNAQPTDNVSAGYSNTGVGYHSLVSNTTGFENTAIGSQALDRNTSGSNNVAMGLFALFFNASGTMNVGIGPGALSAVTDGANNTSVGGIVDIYGTGFPPIVHGSNNSILGYNAGPSGDFSNTLSLGANAQPTASNQVALGDTNITSVVTTGVLQSGGYKSSDGTAGMTGSCGAATTAVIKNGLVVSCS